MNYFIAAYLIAGIITASAICSSDRIDEIAKTSGVKIFVFIVTFLFWPFWVGVRLSRHI